jgi:hypothetical protein
MLYQMRKLWSVRPILNVYTNISKMRTVSTAQPIVWQQNSPKFTRQPNALQIGATLLAAHRHVYLPGPDACLLSRSDSVMLSTVYHGCNISDWALHMVAFAYHVRFPRSLHRRSMCSTVTWIRIATCAHPPFSSEAPSLPFFGQPS